MSRKQGARTVGWQADTKRIGGQQPVCTHCPFRGEALS